MEMKMEMKIWETGDLTLCLDPVPVTLCLRCR